MTGNEVYYSGLESGKQQPAVNAMIHRSYQWIGMN